MQSAGNLRSIHDLEYKLRAVELNPPKIDAISMKKKLNENTVEIIKTLSEYTKKKLHPKACEGFIKENPSVAQYFEQAGTTGAPAKSEKVDSQQK